MAARFKGYRKFKDETEHDTGIKFETYVNGKTGEFIAAWGQHTIAGKVYTDLVAAMKAHIRTENVLEFFPIIVVTEHAPFARTLPYVCFSYDRCYVAERPGENRAVARLEWIDYHGQGDLQVYKNRLHPPGDFRYQVDKLPATFKGHSGNTYVLDYNEALWEGLERLYELVETMQGQFRTLLGTGQGIERIAQVGASGLFLESGENDENV